MNKLIAFFVAVSFIVTSCTAGNQNKEISKIEEKEMENKQTTESKGALVDIKTTMGDIRICLYDATPKHRDNFLKLVNEKFYEGTLFHRVINEFMIQAGDPDSKNAPSGKMLGSGGPGYNVDAEIVYPQYFHKKGALAAARQGDQVNPLKKSSGSQFYIVTGRVYNEGQLRQMEVQLVNKQKQGIFNELAMQHRDQIMSMRKAKDVAGLQALQDSLVAQVESIASQNPASFTPEQKQAYSTVGGSPHLDGDYTVFGEVVSGMDVIEKIEKVATNAQDRPVEDVKIISMTAVK